MHTPSPLKERIKDCDDNINMRVNALLFPYRVCPGNTCLCTFICAIMAVALRRPGILIFSWVVVFSVIILLSQFSYIPIRYRAKLYRTQFLFVVETVLFVANRYIWCHAFASRDNRLNRESDVSRFGTRFLQMLLITFMICAQLSYITNHWFNDTNPHTFSLLCYVCLATLLHVIFALLLINILGSSGKLFQRWQKHHRLILSLLYAVAATLVGFYNVSLPPAVKHVHVPIHNLPNSMDNIHILHISDIHLGPTVGQRRLQEVVDIVNSLRPGEIINNVDTKFVCYTAYV